VFLTDFYPSYIFCGSGISARGFQSVFFNFHIGYFLNMTQKKKQVLAVKVLKHKLFQKGVTPPSATSVSCNPYPAKVENKVSS
jgi:hypothetical protein